MPLNETKVRDNVKSFLTSLKAQDESAYDLINKLANVGEVYFFGGMVRDISLNKKVRDLDLVIKAEKPLDIVLQELRVKTIKNIFNGHKTSTEKFKVDLWHIDDTWAFKNSKLKPNFENLPKTAFLNANSVAFCLNDSKISDNGFMDFYLRRGAKISINFKKNPDEVLCAIRAIHLKNKLQAELNDDLKDYITSIIKRNDYKLINYLSRYLKRYPNDDTCTKDLKDIKSFYFQSLERKVHFSNS